MVIQTIHVNVILALLGVTVKHVITVTVRIVIREELVRITGILIRAIVELVSLEKIASTTVALIISVSINQLVK